MNDYFDYKNDEIKYLKKEYNVFFPRGMNLDDYINSKRDLLTAVQKGYNVNITNKDNKSNRKIFKNPKITYQYSYSRYDSYINYADFSNEFYKLSIRGKYKTKVFFTDSGMSAITSLMLALNHIDKGFNYVFPNVDIYFESYDFYNKYIRNTELKSKNIVYIDTISKEYNEHDLLNFLENCSDIFAIIIDTTCFIPSDLNRFVSKIIKKNKLCILVRSHTKLDMMGAEISSMGSLLYLIPNELDNNSFSTFKKVMIESYYLLGKFGSLSLPKSFPEMIFSKDFKKINEQRIRRIEKNNYNLFEILKKNIKNGKVILPSHKKFVLYILDNNLISEEQNKIIENKIKLFVSNNNSDIYYACSFGFDFIALDSYYDINEKNYVIRISMNDAKDNNVLINDIKEFINDNF